jgi:hypothetical protein
VSPLLRLRARLESAIDYALQVLDAIDAELLEDDEREDDEREDDREVA